MSGEIDAAGTWHAQLPDRACAAAPSPGCGGFVDVRPVPGYRIARAHGIPVFNLAETEPAQAMRRPEGIAASVTAELARRKAEESTQETGNTISRHEARGGSKGRSMRL